MTEAKRPHQGSRTSRISVQFPVTMTLGKKEFNCQALELSEFGILLMSTHKELVGKDVEIGLTLNAIQGVLSLDGIVAYATEAGLGVRFKKLTEETCASLKYYVAQNDNADRRPQIFARRRGQIPLSGTQIHNRRL